MAPHLFSLRALIGAASLKQPQSGTQQSTLTGLRALIGAASLKPGLNAAHAGRARAVSAP